MAQRRPHPALTLPEAAVGFHRDALVTPTGHPAQPTPIRSPASHRHGTSPAYFDSVTSSFSTYDPRTFRSGASTSLTASGTRRGRAEGESNWDTLHELVGGLNEEDEDDARDGPRERGRSARRMTSHSTLRSFFRATPDRSRASSRPGLHRASSAGPPRSLDGVLSSSPPAIDEGFLHRGGDSHKLDGIEERLDAVDDEANGGVDTPLLRHRSPSPAGLSVKSVKPPVRAQSSWRPSPAVIAISKCVIAYFIGSLFTFVPALAHMLSTRSEQDAHGRIRPRPAYSAHLVATIVVYFHPAKSAGNMLLADRYAIILATMAAVVCIMAMLTLNLFDAFSPSLGSKWDWISEAGDWMVNILYIGGSMGLLAWAKIWVANPSFNSGCSMAAVTIYSVVIKEGNVPKLLEILLIVVFGVLIANLVCFTIFPTTATTRLQGSITRSLSSFSTLLDILTATFLLERTVLRANQTTLRQAIADHAKAFKTLKADLAEAKHERLIDPRIRGRKLKLYDAAIASLARLAQHLAGMRSSTRLQEGLIRASREGKINLEEDHLNRSAAMSYISMSALPESETPGAMAVDADGDVKRSVRLFLEFREMAGAQMNDLNAKCDSALDAVQSLTLTTTIPELDLAAIRQDLSTSLVNFTDSSSHAIKQLYVGPRREQEVYENARDDSGDPDLPALGEIVEGPNEAVFLIYFFLFTFEEFAREMCFLLDTMAEIVNADTPSALDHLRSILPIRKDKRQKRQTFLYQQLQNLVPIDPSKLQPELFPRHRPDSQNPHTARGTLGMWRRAKQRWWAFGEWLRQPDKRYAIKIWLGGALLAAPAYTEWGREWFLEYRGEWALIAFFSVNSPTLGQTNAMSMYRSLGTFIGAMVGVLVYSLFPENPILLPLAGLVFSIPCFYIITQIPEHMQTGRFTILAYNLTCLYAYNSRERDYSVWKVALFRSATVIIGSLWAAIVSRYWWPVTARRSLRLGVSDFCLDLSYLYSRLVQTYSRDRPSGGPSEPSTASDAPTENDPLLPQTVTPAHAGGGHSHLSPGVRHFLAMELHLQSQLTYLRELLVQTRNEPRIKGPFDHQFYNEVLLSCERMLDRLHSMRCVTTRDEWDNGIRTEFIAPVNKERRDMAGSVLLYFYTLSAGFSLRTPMPPYLPPAELFRQRLVGAIRGLDVVKRRSVRGGSRHLLYFAYACAMQEVIAELEYLGGLMQDTFGVIGQSTLSEFDELFAHPLVEADGGGGVDGNGGEERGVGIGGGGGSGVGGGAAGRGM